MIANESQKFFKRGFIRHPSDIPLQFNMGDSVDSQQELLNNVGHGGLCFSSRVALAIGTVIHLQIPLTHPAFNGTGQVVWCSPRGKRFDIGVEFTETDVGFRMRMVEQICHIEHYKRKVLKNEGRKLSGEDAAREWIDKYARGFPSLNDGHA